MLAVGNSCGMLGQRTIPSGIAGVLSALLPLVASCLGYVLFREKLARKALIGLAVGFGGVALLLRPGSNLDPFGLMLIGVGQVAWALGAVLAPRLGLPRIRAWPPGRSCWAAARWSRWSQRPGRLRRGRPRCGQAPVLGRLRLAHHQCGRRVHGLRLPRPARLLRRRHHLLLRQPGDRDVPGLAALRRAGHLADGPRRHRHRRRRLPDRVHPDGVALLHAASAHVRGRARLYRARARQAALAGRRPGLRSPTAAAGSRARPPDTSDSRTAP